ncbi:hypothetical protein [Pseudarthrobacter sp. H2]|uniref:hypothetical protein n=1 Tax=Pseudarthrobacter sp. H2 TaxID=3418415 RepID=UPI003CF60D9C
MEQGYEVVTSGKDLALRLMAKGRTKPAAVISWHPQLERNRIDVDHIAREVGGLAEIFCLENGGESYIFQDHLSAGAHVFGNAARVYSADLRWMRDVYQSPLRMAGDRPAAARAAEDIIEDVLSLITVVPPKTRPAAAAPRRVRGTIRAFTSAGSRAIVELDDGTRCSIQRERVVPPVRLDWMLAPGQPIEGLFNDEDKALDVNELKATPRLAELYRSGDLVLALAEEVTARGVELTLFPGSSWSVGADCISSNPLDTADSLVTEGEVVVARFLREQGAVVLSLLDVDDDAEVKESPALLAGGTPWLRAGRHLAEQSRAGRTFVAPGADVAGTASTDAVGSKAEASAPAPKPSAALLSAQLQLDAERRKVAALQELVSAGSQAGARLVSLQKDREALKLQLETERKISDAANADLEAARARLARQREELQGLRTRNRETQQALKRAQVDPGELFATLDARLRHDVYLSWVRNTPAAEKARQALPPGWKAGPEFAASLYAFTEPGVAAKALKATVEILTGAAERNPARELHPLRANAAGDTPPHRRDDGATCFRVAIEKNVAAARRLHFWRLPDGAIELSRVVVHDDYKP